jgi:two-component system LytT family sensor kinase
LTRITLTGDQYILFLLFLRLGIMASIAGVLVTSNYFKRLIFIQTRTRREDWWFALIFGALITAGTAVRLLVGYEGVDISMPGIFLIGLLCGSGPGIMAALLVSVPAVLGGEWLTPFYLAACAALGGAIGMKPERREEIWGFTPFFYRNLTRSWKNFRDGRRLDAVAMVFLSVLALDVSRTVLAGYLGKRTLFAFTPDHYWMNLLVWFSTLACIGIPLKIWDNTRVEMLLEEQRAAAVQAKFDALRRQINPHFFFNTLNAATSCIWSEPDKTRWILVKLAGILRKLLHGTEDFVPLSGELEFIDDYLSLEQARFGAERIRVEKEIDPRALDVPVPSMLLQPLVENAVRHGISGRVDGGTIRVEAENDGEKIRIVVRDDGKGFAGEAADGIGLRNVRERLSVAYGLSQSMTIDSVPGEGTEIRIEIPVERERHAE